MGITVLIVTAVSTSYKREASPEDLLGWMLRFGFKRLATDSTEIWKSQYSADH
jgi:hypothetical protein